MWIKTFFKSSTSTASRRRPTRRPASRLCVEALEDRLVPSFTIGDYNIGIYSDAALAADFNNDLIQDLVLSTGSNPNSAVSIRLGNGHGTFGAAQSFPTGTGDTSSIAAGDFNRDGKVDLAFTKYGQDAGYYGYPTVLFGNGDGTFQSPRGPSLKIPPAPFGQWIYNFSTFKVGVTDANADGRPDLVSVGEVSYLEDNGENLYSYGYTAACLGDGNGGFTQSFGVLTGYGSGDFAYGQFAAVDLNADGKVDMVGSNGARFGRGDGTFDTWQGFSAGPGGYRVAVDDFNGDGKLDIAATNAASGTTSGSGCFIRLGNGDGTVQPAQSYASGVAPRSLAMADFNRDGKTDLVTANAGVSWGYGSVTVCLGNGNGTFQAPLSFPTSPDRGGALGYGGGGFQR
jgi:hypothetical protein